MAFGGAVSADSQAPKLTRVIGSRDAAGLTARIAGRGLNLGRHESAAFDAAGNEIVWREVQRDVDRRGGIHITYKQYLVGEGFEAELVGAGMATHWDASGALTDVDGVQFEQVKLANRPVLAAGTALERAVRVARRFGGETAAAELKLVPEGDAFRFVYFTQAVNEEGAPERVVIDAENEKVISRATTTAYGNCSSTATPAATATAYPVRSGLLPRTGLTVTAATRPEGFTHEASFLYSGVKITAFQHIQSNPSTAYSAAWKCVPTEVRSYTVFPLRADAAGGTPLFVNRASSDDRPWQGNEAGDAYWNTYQTIRTFVNLGRRGWDNGNGDANIVIDHRTRRDQGVFNFHGATDPTVPYNSVMIGESLDFYSMAASLDNVAHEFGHGMLFTSVGWQYVNSSDADLTVQRQLHEGWADVIAMIVEKRRQPSGTGLEQDSDWTMHEDSGTGGYARGAIDDYSSHVWKGRPRADGTVPVRTINDKVHRYDNHGNYEGSPHPLHSDHSIGNMLNVVHRLMSDGGTNSACGRLFQSCPSVPALGSSTAGYILFQALQYRIRSWHRWEHLMEAVKQETFNQYNGCNWDPMANAQTEQLAVINAFKNIGYADGNTNIINCP